MPGSGTEAILPGSHLSGAMFKYSESLRGRKIRLLSLKPGGGDEVVHFDLETYSIANCPNYIALSYTWGNPADTVPVLCDGKAMQVTRNLKAALWQLRENRKRLLRSKDSGLHHTQSIRFWIDAICINQLDMEEKTLQVRLMAKIYKRAWHVFAWLGPADENSDMVVDYLNKIGEEAEACGMVEGCEPYVSVWREMAFGLVGHRKVDSTHIRFKRLNETVFSVPRVKLRKLLDSISGWAGQDSLLPLAGMKKFFTRPWWGRIWVLQEVTFAKDADFICGSKMISKTRCSAAINAYSTLWEILAVAFRRDCKSLTQYQRNVMTNLVHHRPVVMLSMSRVNREGGFSLSALLRATCVGTLNPRRHVPQHLESTKPEDKIFALLGLAVDREELTRLGVFPRYGITYKEVYTTTMVALLKQGHISLLSMCQAAGSLELPSWVPDWSQSVTDMLQDVEDDHETLYPVFKASGDRSRESTVEILRSKKAILGISVMGHIYDEIYQVGSFRDRADDKVVPIEKTFSWPVEWLMVIICLTYCPGNKDQQFSDRLKAAGRTSIGGVGYNRNARLERVGDSRFMDAAVLLQAGSKALSKKHVKAQAERFLANNLIIPTETTTAFGSEIIGKSLGRIPFVTKKGNLGLSSIRIASGDIVAVILGCQVPFILRPDGKGSYQVIGEAYVDGIMDGEATSLSDCCSIVLV